MFYDNIRSVCESKGTTITQALEAIGRSTGSTGRWKTGQLPTLTILMELADYLDSTLDELVYGHDAAMERLCRIQNVPVNLTLTNEQKEWLELMDAIPESRRDACRDFLRTHEAIPKCTSTMMDA